MFDMIPFFHYSIIGLIVTLPAAAAAFGQRTTGRSAIENITTQPQAQHDLLRSYVLGVALNEMAAIMSVIMGAFLLFKNHPISLEHTLVEIGIFCAVVIPACLVGYLSAEPHRMAMESLTRQPFLASRIINLMILTISMMQMSVILGMFVAFILQLQLSEPEITLLSSIKYMAAGLTFGGASIGPLIGMSRFTKTACHAVGLYPNSYGNVLSIAFISPALIETPILFALGVALSMIARTALHPAALIAAALAMGLSTFGPGIASGTVAATACRFIAQEPERSSQFTYTSMVVQTLIEASCIYGLIIAIVLVLFGAYE